MARNKPIPPAPTDRPITGQLEIEYVQAAHRWHKSRKETRKAFYMGVMDGIERAMLKLVGEKETKEMINLAGIAIKYKEPTKGRR